MTGLLRHRGINYDTGTRYAPDVDSRPDWSPALMRRHLTVIQDELHANAVTVFGSHVDRLVAAAEHALGLGLEVWVQPRLPDATVRATLTQLDALAVQLETLRGSAAPLRLTVGCELTVFAAGLIPGRGYAQRGRGLRWTWPLLPLFSWRLDRVLRRAVRIARRSFGGDLTYGAGSWETVRWSRFDAVGVNAYRDATNERSYADGLRRFQRHGKPVLVTEFGCCSYRGAAARGAEGDAVVDWSDPAGAIVGSQVRDEDVQATYLGELLDTFVAAGVDGAFVFEFSEPLYGRSDDPRHDLDIASFGIVAVERTGGADGDAYRETPKAAFQQIARRYRAAQQPPGGR